MKKKTVIFLLVLFIFAQIFITISLERDMAITGFFFKIFGLPNLMRTIGEFALSVMGGFRITIYSPQPIVYFEHNLNLNVSADAEISEWRFSLERLSGACFGEEVYSNVGFIPNISFFAARGINNLTVYALATDGRQENASVVFNVSTANTAPEIVFGSDYYYACEGKQFSTLFEVVDNNIDCISDENLVVNETPPFYVYIHNKFLNITSAELFSDFLGKAEVGLHRLLVSANDGESLTEKILNVSVLEINNQPMIFPVDVLTLDYYNFTNPNFYYEVDASDIEDGNSRDGNLIFNSSFLEGDEFFSINETTGIINFTYNESVLGVYTVRICVEDRGVAASPESLSYCGEDGSPKSSCTDWNFVVVYINRPPVILNFSNSKTLQNLTLEINVGELVRFNITAYDPDGNLPYIDWYLDRVFLRRNLSGYDEFYFLPTMSDIGEHRLLGVATDLFLNDSVLWNITVIGPPIVNPPSGPGGGGGGGAPGKAKPGCKDKWGCNEWSTCQKFSEEDMSLFNLKRTCELFKISDENCGYQSRKCLDFGDCGNNLSRPKDIQVCFFTTNPSCNDEIRNCHDGGCELMIDCGGPCSRCPTCSDGKKNQNEEGVDCGGPCPSCSEVPFFDIRKRMGIAVNFFILLAILLLLFIIYEVIRIRRLRHQFGKKITKIVRPDEASGNYG